MNRTTARILSWVFHPLFIPLFTFLLVNSQDQLLLYHPAAYKIVLGCLLVNIAAPAIGIWTLMRRGTISDIEVSERGQRFPPFVLVIFYFVCTYAIFRYHPGLLSEAMMSVLLAIPVSLLFALGITFFWKISIHAMALGGAVGAIVGISMVHQVDLTLIVVLFVLMGGAVSSARVKLGLHSLNQVYMGFLLGLVVNLLLVSQQWFL